MKYIEAVISTASNGIEIVSDRLISIGITDIAVNDPEDIEDLLDKKNAYDWDYIDSSVLEGRKSEPTITLYVSDDQNGCDLIKTIQAELEQLKKEMEAGAFGENIDLGRLVLKTKVVNDEDWKDNWKEYFKPANITKRIVVKPTWENYEKKNDEELVIEIDPGMAFGTGTHPTTSCCVKLLEKYMKHGDKVLDVGCGSGILAISAGLLGAGEVLGIEIDPIAVDVGRENVELNRLSKIVRVELGDLTKGIDFKANIVVANLMADLVKMLSKDVAKHLLGNGIYISSGILVELKESVAEVIEASGFKIVEVLEDGEWCAIAASMV